MDFDKARYFMVEQQIRPWDVSDADVLARFMTVKREDFVAPALRQLAFADIQLPIAHGATMLEPKMEGRLLQAAQIMPDERVLIVGAGSGYLMALAAGLCHHVYGVEIDGGVFDVAVKNLAANKVRNTTLRHGDGLAGLPESAPFDVILLTGSVATVPAALISQLTQNGRIIAMTGQLPTMQLERITQSGTTKLFEYALPRLTAEQQTAFAF
jgi:protein-L-isoaspartate(D-aspartate) O-methyltransferase